MPLLSYITVYNQLYKDTCAYLVKYAKKLRKHTQKEKQINLS